MYILQTSTRKFKKSQCKKDGALTKTFLVLSEKYRWPSLYEDSDSTQGLETGFSRRCVLAELCDLKLTRLSFYSTFPRGKGFRSHLFSTMYNKTRPPTCKFTRSTLDLGLNRLQPYLDKNEQSITFIEQK